VARKTPLVPARIAVLALLALLIASCGGGSTAGPIAPSRAATTTTAPGETQSVATVPGSAAAPGATATAPAPRTPAPPPSGSGAAPAPSEPAEAGSPADAPAAAAGTPAAARADEPAPDPQPSATLLDERAKLILTRRVSPSHYFQQGTVTGTYDGTIELEARITSRGVLVRFTATLPGGTISGRGVAVAILDSTTWPALRGSALVTGGSGRFAGIRGRGLKVTGRSKPDASRTHVRLVGTVRLD